MQWLAVDSRAFMTHEWESYLATQYDPELHSELETEVPKEGRLLLPTAHT